MATVVVTSSLPTPSINISSPPSHSSTSYSTTSSSTSTLVPQYPYNVSMPPFAGALLPYERAPMPDDNDVQTRLPSRCVDYLSHDWDESDVWTSWKAMTRHKNGLANGVRLENASWRTWAKQRSNLKTISPETLNWLKDSDVTWLYGPLHTAVDPVPPAKVSSLQDRFNLDGQNAPSSQSMPGSALNSRSGSSASVRTAKAPGKPILKHRSLSEILGVGLSSSTPTIGTGVDSSSENGSDDHKSDKGQSKRTRVTIAHTASDSTLVNRSHCEAGRGSPPTLGTGYESSDAATSGEDSDINYRGTAQDCSKSTPKPKTVLKAAGSSATVNGLDEPVKPKKHISFSHRVEQCIAVDSEEERGAYAVKGKLKASARPAFAAAPHVVDDDDDDDDDDDILTFRSSAPRHPTLHAVSNHRHHPGSIPAHSADLGIPGLPAPVSGASIHIEPYTIARMAPTTLKSSEVLPAPSPVVVYNSDPTWGGVHSHSFGPSDSPYTLTSSPSTSVSARPYEHHQLDNLLPNNIAGPSKSTHSPPIYASHTFGPVSSKVTAPPITSQCHDDRLLAPIQHGSSSSLKQWVTAAPDDDDTEEFTAMGFDYFSGPDLGLGDEYDMSRLPSQHLGSFPNGSNTSDTSGGGLNEDSSSSFPRSILKVNPTSPPVGTSNRAPVPTANGQRYTLQEPVMVPQVKSTSYKNSVANSSSSSSLSSSPLSHPNDSSSSSIANPPPSSDKPRINSTNLPIPSSSSSSSLVNMGQDRPDRVSRGRSSSRGSSASSFERSSTDRRPSSNSPSQSPPARSIPVSIGSVVHGVSRPGSGLGSRANSYDGSRSFSARSSLINVTIGEEAEYEEEDGSQLTTPIQVQTQSPQKGACDQKTSMEPDSSGSALVSSSSKKDLGINTSTYNVGDDSPTKSKPSSPVNDPGLHKPCLISAPKPASAQLDEASTVAHSPSTLTMENSNRMESVGHQRSSVGSESNGPGSPTLRSILSKQSASSLASSVSSRRPDSLTGRQSDTENPSLNPREIPRIARPSLKPRNSDGDSYVNRSGGFGIDEEALRVGRSSKSMDVMRRLSGDEFGFVNYWGNVIGEEEEEEEQNGREDDVETTRGGMISRAAEIVGTAREIVGAIWSVGSRSIWGAGLGDTQEERKASDHQRKRTIIRRASTGGLPEGVAGKT